MNVDYKHLAANVESDEVSIKAIQMSQWTEYLIENQTARELIETIEDNVFDDVVAMALLDVEGPEALNISEGELESVIIDALERLLEGREISVDALIDIASDSGIAVHRLVDEGIVFEYDNKFYEGENN